MAFRDKNKISLCMKFLFLFYLQTIAHSLERSLINIKLLIIKNFIITFKNIYLDYLNNFQTFKALNEPIWLAKKP